jgi:hypothetical protein
MAIEIIDKQLNTDVDVGSVWALFVQIDDGIDEYLLATTLPGTVAEIDLQATLEADETRLFAIAQVKGILPDDLYTSASTKRVLKAFALVMLDEINILRTAAAMAPRTTTQLRTAVKNKLQTL